MISYRATLEVSRELVAWVARLLRAERRRRGTRKGTRALSCHQQAVLVLRHFREDTDPTRLAGDHGISRATGYRYLDEATAVLAAQAPDLHQALRWAHEQGKPYVICDGKLFEADRCTQQTISVKGRPIDVWYSGKHRAHGGNIQALSAPNGHPLWVSDVEPGSVHDLTAAREHLLGGCSWAASQLGLPTLADGGYQGAGAGVHTPVPKPAGNQQLDPDTRTYNVRCADCAPSANAASPCWSNAGTPCATSPPAPARSAPPSKPRSP